MTDEQTQEINGAIEDLQERVKALEIGASVAPDRLFTRGELNALSMFISRVTAFLARMGHEHTRDPFFKSATDKLQKESDRLAKEEEENEPPLPPRRPSDDERAALRRRGFII